MREASSTRPTTMAEYLALFRRRKVVFIIPLILVPLAALGFSERQGHLYQATAEIFVKRTSLVSAITGVDPAFGEDPTRAMATQADFARSPALIQLVASRAGVPGVTPGSLSANSTVSPRSNADLLDIAVKARRPGDAVRLVNAYAQQFTTYKTQFDTASVNQAVATVKARVNELRNRGATTTSPAYATLLDTLLRLQTAGKLLAGNTSVLRLADGAAQIRPRPTRDALLGGLLGLVLGVGFVFLTEALDRRVRSEQEVEEALGVPLLARIPKPRRALRKNDRLVMLAEPWSVQAESFRKLRTNVEFLNFERPARKIMVTSAVQREGKSTTIANLAVVLARSGRSVALVDLDLRRPFLHRFFGLPGAPGITDVVVGRARLAEAIRPIALAGVSVGARRGARRTNGRHSPSSAQPANGRGQVDAVLNVLPAGTIPPAPGELIDNEAVGAALDALAERHDYVLIDAPPMLAVGDAMALSAKVDAIISVARLAVVQRPVLHELARQLESCPAPVLGFVLAGAERGESYGYGHAYGYGRVSERGEQPVA